LEFSNFPLIWVKSDNVGILPDPKRGPRRIYETALVASREDRWIAKPVSNAYSCPTDKSTHPSTKPEPMLRHFFQMYVSETTRLLDPTCGSGSALRAAESLGAEYVWGLEQDKTHFDNATSALRNFRMLRMVNK
jgi:DNA modification methylase